MNAAPRRPHARARRGHPARPLRRAAALGALALVAGCTPTIQVTLTPPDPKVVQWQRDITATVNDHAARLQTLEAAQPKGETR
jgi:hypothetical protein